MSSSLGRWKARRIHLEYYLRTWEFLRRNMNAKRDEKVYPTLIQIGTINRCNGRCAMCPYPDTVAKEPRAEMDEALVTKILDEIASWPVKSRLGGMVGFTMQNEPLLDARLPRLLAMAREKLAGRWEVELTTNGTLLSDEMASGIARARPDVVNVSVNGFSQFTYDKVMPGFSVKDVFANLHAFLAMKSPETDLIIRYVKQSANDADFTALRDYWTRHGVAVVGYECNDRLGDVRNYEKIRSRAGTALRNLSRKALGRSVFRMCPFLFSQTNVLPDGKVILCCHDYRHVSLMGSLSERTLAEIYNSEDYRRLRSEARAGKYTGICLRCSLFKTHIWL